MNQKLFNFRFYNKQEKLFTEDFLYFHATNNTFGRDLVFFNKASQSWRNQIGYLSNWK